MVDYSIFASACLLMVEQPNLVKLLPCYHNTLYLSNTAIKTNKKKNLTVVTICF